MTLIGCTHSEAVQTLRRVGDEIAMMICDGFCDVSVSRDRGTVAAAAAEEKLTEPVVLTHHCNTLTTDSNSLVAHVYICQSFSRSIGQTCYHVTASLLYAGLLTSMNW